MDDSKEKKGGSTKKNKPAAKLYIVEAIKAKEKRDGIDCYLIQWRGYDEQTWEPVAAIKHLDVAKHFEKEHGKPAKKPQKDDKDQKLKPAQERHDPSRTVDHFVQGLSDKEKEALKRCEQPPMSRINTGVAVKKIVGMEKTTDQGEEKSTLYYVHFADNAYEKVPGALLERMESKMLCEFLHDQLWKVKMG